jgi:tetratricopeptide (TPR) repeat protein
MTLLNHSLTTWLNRPYFDLGEINQGALHVHGIEYSYRNLFEKPSFDSENITHPISLVQSLDFRESLMRETDLFKYQIDDPIELPETLRTKRWNKLCEYLYNYRDLNSIVKTHVIGLLISLCFHKAVLTYIPEISKTVITSDAALLRLSYYRSISKLMSQTDAINSDNLKDFEIVANHAPLGSSVRFNAIIELISLYAKSLRDLNATEFWSSKATQELAYLKSSANDFSYKLFTSIYCRATVFVPLLQRNRKAVIQEMDWCESLARSLTCEGRGEVQEIAAKENLITVFESRTKEALWLGDIDLAESRAKQLVEMEPLYSRYRLQLGEILLKQKKIEEAAKMYRSAARLGPPGTPIAWFMAGQCYERLDELELACDCYLASIGMDELSISAVERLNKLAPRLDNLALKNWSAMRLQQLQEQQNSMVSHTKSSYIPEASSELKVSGKLVTV